MDSEVAPAGYFSTFSILDPNNPSAEGQARSQKRNRRVFVCLPCHKRKLRCDKKLPCGRCVSSGAEDECVYQPFPSATTPRQTKPPEKGQTPPKIIPQDRFKADYRVRDGRARISGPTHWANIASEFEEATPFLYGTDSRWQPRYQQIKNLKYLFPAVGGNFPFSPLCSLTSKSLRIPDLLPPRPVVEALVVNYLDTFETTHRVLHPLQFRDELDTLWKAPERLSQEWLSQLCMMLALGSTSAPEYLLQSTSRTVAMWREQFLDAAELGFGRSPYMLSPNLTTLRTMCMMVLAKLTELRASNTDQLVYFMGFVARLAMTLQLHRSTKMFPEMPPFEAEMRRRLWVTVQLLDLDVAMRSGTTPLTLDHDADAPANADEVSFRRVHGGGWAADRKLGQPQEYTDGTFQGRAADILPVLAEAIHAINSPTAPTPEYEKVLAWDAKIRKKLRDTEAILYTARNTSHKRAERAGLQHQFLEVVGHRTLLAIHHTYASIPKSDSFEQSRIAVMESSLALLDIHQIWAAPLSRCPSMSSESCSSVSPGSSPTIVGGEPRLAPSWLSDLCHDDFGAATIYAMLAFKRHDFENPPSEDVLPAVGSSSFDVHPTRMACHAIQQAVLLMRDTACRSISHFKEFLGCSIMGTCMRCWKTGEHPLARMMELVNAIEQLVVTGRQDTAWATPGSSLAYPSTTVEQQLDVFMTLDTLGAFT